MLRIIAEIKPVPMARARVNTKTYGRYLPLQSAQFQYEMSLIAKAAMKGRRIFESLLKVTIHFYKKVKVGSRNYGDVDNHVKAVLDALNDIVWRDDALIVELHAFKHTGEPKIEIEIEEAI